jgi:5'-nucleotidase
MPLMKFKLINCNYSFSHPALLNNILPYHVIKSGKYKVGITGVGVGLDQLKNAAGITWYHPYERANAIATYLKKQLHCELVICLSHLGYMQPAGIPDNISFAKASEDIDLIISGHHDSINPEIMVSRNHKKQEVMISHGAPGGLLVKQVSFIFDKLGQKQQVSYKNFIPGLMPGRSAYEEIRVIMQTFC